LNKLALSSFTARMTEKIIFEVFVDNVIDGYEL
jgi:hypothetical protein